MAIDGPPVVNDGNEKPQNRPMRLKNSCTSECRQPWITDRNREQPLCLRENVFLAKL